MFDKPLDAWPEITNFNERIVVQLVRDYAAADKLPCRCRECTMDIVALSLNSLPSRYTVSLLRKFYETEAEERIFLTEIKAAVDRAVARVQERPHH